MTFLGWVGFGFVLLLAVAAVIVTVACCMRSSQISRQEESREYPWEPIPPLEEKYREVDTRPTPLPPDEDIKSS